MIILFIETSYILESKNSIVLSQFCAYYYSHSLFRKRGLPTPQKDLRFSAQDQIFGIFILEIQLVSKIVWNSLHPLLYFKIQAAILLKPVSLIMKDREHRVYNISLLINMIAKQFNPSVFMFDFREFFFISFSLANDFYPEATGQ